MTVGEGDRALLRDLRFHFRCGDDAEFRQQVAEFAEALTRVNTLELLKYGEGLACCLSCGGVRYIPPPSCGTDRPCQEVYDVLNLYARKRGTCFDLAAERAARHRVEAIEAGAEFPAEAAAWVVVEDQVQQSPYGDEFNEVVPGRYHAFVERADGAVEDPSEELQGKVGADACQCGGHDGA